MNTKELKKFKKEAWSAGENDTITEDHLIQGAILFIEHEVLEEITDEQHEEIVEAYRAGFMGKKLS